MLRGDTGRPEGKGNDQTRKPLAHTGNGIS